MGKPKQIQSKLQAFDEAWTPELETLYLKYMGYLYKLYKEHAAWQHLHIARDEFYSLIVEEAKVRGVSVIIHMRDYVMHIKTPLYTVL